MPLQIVKLLNPVQMTIAGTFTPKGAYDNATDYTVGDMVDYNGSSYIMYSDATAGTLPTDNTKWGIVAEKGATGATGATGAQGDPGTTDYNALTNLPTLGTAAATDITDYATAAQGVLADSALQSVVAGTNVTVDNTDPQNPVISATGGGASNWGDLGGTLSDQTDLQTALDAKQNTITGLTASGSELNILDGATLSTTELNYVDGVTSAIQTQLDAKADDTDLASYLPLAGGTMTGNLISTARQLIGTGSLPTYGQLVVRNGTGQVGLALHQSVAPGAFSFFEAFNSGGASMFRLNEVGELYGGYGGAAIRPFTDSSGTLGTSSAYWSNTYTDRLYLNSTAYIDGAGAGIAALTGALTVSGTTTLSGSVTLSGAIDVNNRIKLGGGGYRSETTLRNANVTLAITSSLNNRCDATSASFTITLPAANASNGQTLWFKKIDSTANTVTIQRAGSDTIDGQTSVVLTSQYDCIELVNDASSKWLIRESSMDIRTSPDGSRFRVTVADDGSLITTEI